MSENVQSRELAGCCMLELSASWRGATAIMMLAVLLLLPGSAVEPQTATIELFRHGDDGVPCYRIPSLLTIPSRQPVVLALAECRQFVGDGCYPWTGPNATLKQAGWGANRYICARRSTDAGRSFGPIAHNITRMRSSNNAVVWEPRTRTVVVFFNDASPWLHGRPNGGGAIHSVNSTDLGMTWSPAAAIRIVGPRPAAAAAGMVLGPGRALVLGAGSSTPGRMLLAGASSVALGQCPDRPDGGQCKRQTAFVIYSDDTGAIWRFSAASIPHLEGASAGPGLFMMRPA
jgi:hypothetical protein